MKLSRLRKWRYSPCGDTQILSREYLLRREKAFVEFRLRRQKSEPRPPIFGLLLGSALADAVVLGLVRRAGAEETPIYFYDSDVWPKETPTYGSDDPGVDDPSIWMPGGTFDYEEPAWFLHEVKHAIDDARGKLDVDPRLRGRSNEEVASEEHKRLWRKDRCERRTEMFMKRHLIRTGNLKPKETK